MNLIIFLEFIFILIEAIVVIITLYPLVQKHINVLLNYTKENSSVNKREDDLINNRIYVKSAIQSKNIAVETLDYSNIISPLLGNRNSYKFANEIEQKNYLYCFRNDTYNNFTNKNLNHIIESEISFLYLNDIINVLNEKYLSHALIRIDNNDSHKDLKKLILFQSQLKELLKNNPEKSNILNCSKVINPYAFKQISIFSLNIELYYVLRFYIDEVRRLKNQLSEQEEIIIQLKKENNLLRLQLEKSEDNNK